MCLVLEKNWQIYLFDMFMCVCALDIETNMSMNTLGVERESVSCGEKQFLCEILHGASNDSHLNELNAP